MLKTSLFLACALFSSVYADTVKTDVELSQGYRREKLDFSVAGPQHHPNVLSELKFKDVDVYVTRLAVTLSKNDYFLKGIASYGIVYDGTTTDKDYLLDNRKGQFLHSKHDITGDYTADFIVRLGKHFTFDNSFVVSPHIGYGTYLQKLRFKHGYDQWVHPATGKHGPKHKMHNLNSTYRATWYSPQVGIDLKKKICKNVVIFAQYSFLYPLKYDAKGHWNLRTDGSGHFDLSNKALKSFGHDASIGAEWEFTENWSIKAEYELMKFYTKDGHVHIHKYHQPMNKAHLSSSEVRLTVGYAF